MGEDSGPRWSYAKRAEGFFISGASYVTNGPTVFVLIMLRVLRLVKPLHRTVKLTFETSKDEKYEFRARSMERKVDEDGSKVWLLYGNGLHGGEKFFHEVYYNPECRQGTGRRFKICFSPHSTVLNMVMS